MSRNKKDVFLTAKSPARFISTGTAQQVTDANRNTIYNNMAEPMSAYVYVGDEYHKVYGLDILVVDTIDIPKKK